MPRKQNSENELAVSRAAAAPTPARRKAAGPQRKKYAVTPAEPVASLAEAAGIVSETETIVVATVPEVAPAPVVAKSEPTYEQIAALAYELWQARGCQGGSPEEDWLTAEQQLRARN